MSKLTVTYKIKAKKRKPEKRPDTPSPEKPGTRPVSRAARMLALAHYVERLVEAYSTQTNLPAKSSRASCPPSAVGPYGLPRRPE